MKKREQREGAERGVRTPGAVQELCAPRESSAMCSTSARFGASKKLLPRARQRRGRGLRVTRHKVSLGPSQRQQMGKSVWAAHRCRRKRRLTRHTQKGRGTTDTSVGVRKRTCETTDSEKCVPQHPSTASSLCAPHWTDQDNDKGCNEADVQPPEVELRSCTERREQRRGSRSDVLHLALPHLLLKLLVTFLQPPHQNKIKSPAENALRGGHRGAQTVASISSTNIQTCAELHWYLPRRQNCPLRCGQCYPSCSLLSCCVIARSLPRLTSPTPPATLLLCSFFAKAGATAPCCAGEPSSRAPPWPARRLPPW